MISIIAIMAVPVLTMFAASLKSKSVSKNRSHGGKVPHFLPVNPGSVPKIQTTRRETSHVLTGAVWSFCHAVCRWSRLFCYLNYDRTLLRPRTEARCHPKAAGLIVKIAALRSSILPCFSAYSISACLRRFSDCSAVKPS